jgi:hypothetical protein
MDVYVYMKFFYSFSCEELSFVVCPSILNTVRMLVCRHVYSYVNKVSKMDYIRHNPQSLNSSTH